MKEGYVKTNNLLKRILSLSLILTIIISLFAPYSVVFAASSNTATVTFSTDARNIKSGDTVNVKIEVQGGDNPVTVDGYLLYDENQFDVVQVKGNESLIATTETYDDQDDYIYITVKNPCINTYIGTIELTAKKDITTFEIGLEDLMVTMQDAESEDLGTVKATLPPSTATHQVTYNYQQNGGTGLTGGEQETEQVAEGGNIDVSTKQAERAGYTFVGWTNDPVGTTPLPNLQMEDQDVTLYAIFKKDLTVTYKYYDNNGQMKTETETASLYNNDVDVQITLKTLSEDYIENGNTWTKVGWTTDTAVTGSTLQESSTQQISSDTTYNMIYSRQIKVKYDVNGGSTLPPTEQIGTIKVNSSDVSSIQGAQITIDSSTPTKAGYTFKDAWNENQTQDGTSHAKGSQATFTKDTTLYAEWEANINTEYKVKHFKQQLDGSYNEGNPDKTETLQGTTDQTATASPDNDILSSGYELDTDKSSSTQSGTITGDGNLELKLYYKLKGDIEYKIKYFLEQADGHYEEQTGDEKTLTGVVGQTVYAEIKQYEGYTQDPGNSDSKTDGQIIADGSLELKVYYKLNEYTVRYENEDGTEIESKTVKHGQHVDQPTQSPTKASTPEFDYAFEKWVDDKGGDIDFDHIKDNVTAKPKFTQTKRKYTITFYKDKSKGEQLDEQEVEYGSAATYQGVTPTKDPEADGTYEFVGWEDENGIDVDITNVTETKDVYPKFNKVLNKYTVTFDLNYAGSTGNITKEYEHGSQYENFPNPTRPGYTITGWYDNADESQGTKANESDTVTSAHTLWAHWEKAEYTVTFDPNDGILTESNTKQVTYLEPYGPLPEPTRTGYTFLGWYDDKDNGNLIEDSTPVTQTKKHVLYAHWETTKYKVEFKGKNSAGEDAILATVLVEHGTNVTQALLSEQGINISDLQKDVQTQEYYYKYISMESEKLSNVTENRTVQINYEATKKSYTITFYNDDEQTILGTASAQYGEQADDTYINPVKAQDQRYSYTFAEWVDEDGNTDDLSNVVADRNVYAKYTTNYIEYEIIFEDEDGEEIERKSNYHYEDPIEFPEDQTKEATPEFTYEFVGWEDEEGNVVLGTSGEQVTKNKTYKAKFNATKNQYTITFYDEDKHTNLGTSTVDYGESATAPIIPTKQSSAGYDYKFDKWVTDAEIEDDLSNVVANRDVYATYTKTPIEYTITYVDTRDAANSNRTTYTVEDSEITLLPLGQKIGMKFIGWYTDTTYLEEVKSINPSRMENITVYAKWDIEDVMYFAKESADLENEILNPERLFKNFDDAKAYVDGVFDNGNGPAIGIYDLNNDLVYLPELPEKFLYYVKDDASVDNSQALEYDNFDNAKDFVDNLFKQGTTKRVYDKDNNLIYEPKEELPNLKYIVKITKDDGSTEETTFEKFSEAKQYADDHKSEKAKVFDANDELVYEPSDDDLYLKSQVYKIGFNNIGEYEKNDEYIYRVPANTKLSDFIANCDTNGKITVYKEDGSQLTNDDLIGTGMTLKDEKGNKLITLTISVIGDANGNAKLDTADLTTIRGNIYENSQLSEAVKLSMDIDGNGKVTTKDLTLLRGALYEGKILN